MGPGGVWFAVYGDDEIARAPACALGLSASFAKGTLTMNFDLGIETPATLSILLYNGGSVFEPFSKAIPAIAPPHAFTLNWSIPNAGNVTVQPQLAEPPTPILCSEWVTVNTSP
jgi:hypothetical protein